jgi:hypothetical protein
MRPIGLTFKAQRNRYSRTGHGELMLIHLCSGCGAISINRIAADDLAPMILEVFSISFDLAIDIQLVLRESGIRPLTQNDNDAIHGQLYETLVTY